MKKIVIWLKVASSVWTVLAAAFIWSDIAGFELAPFKNWESEEIELSCASGIWDKFSMLGCFFFSTNTLVPQLYYKIKWWITCFDVLTHGPQSLEMSVHRFVHEPSHWT